MPSTDYLALCALKQQYERATMTGRGLHALAVAIRELEQRLWPRVGKGEAGRR